MRSTALTLAVAGLVLLTGCLGAAPLQTDAGTSHPDGADVPTVSASGTGEVTAEADLAVVSVSVVSRAETAEAARADAATRSEALTAALADAGVPEDAVETTGFSLRADYDRDREPTGFVATHSYRVEVAPGEAGTVVDVAVGAAATTVDGVHFTLTDETRTSLRAEALSRAVSDARADADTVAEAAGLTVTGVETAAVGGDHAPYRSVAYAEDAAGGAASTFQPGPVSVTAQVSLVYEAAAA
jgi:hypothetical protein